MDNTQQQITSHLIAMLIVEQEIKRRGVVQFLAEKFGIDTIELEAYVTNYLTNERNKEFFVERVQEIAKSLKFE